MAKESFEVKVIIASEERVLRIQSSEREQEGDTSFSVSCGSETFGSLRRGNDGWEWSEGTRSQEDAHTIGAEIDAHLDQ